MKPGTRVIHIEQHNIGHFVDTILDNYDFL
jgi:hypothetical protein